MNGPDKKEKYAKNRESCGFPGLSEKEMLMVFIWY